MINNLGYILALTKSQFHIEGGVLYYLKSDGILRVIPLTASRQELFEKAHGGTFGGHLCDTIVSANSAYS